MRIGTSPYAHYLSGGYSGRGLDVGVVTTSAECGPETGEGTGFVAQRSLVLLLHSPLDRQGLPGDRAAQLLC